MSTKHSKAAAEFLKNKKQAAWHDETLWLVRAKRDRLSKEVPEWEELRNMACATKLIVTAIWTNYWWSLKTMRVLTELMSIGQRMRMSIVTLSTIF